MTHAILKEVSKKYQITNLSKRAKLKIQVADRWLGLKLKEGNLKYRSALEGVSLTVRKGEALALIGRNGAGKSTLLKILSGTLAADSGSLDVVGKVGGLIELGAGLDQSKTGRENATDRARVLGVPESELEFFVSEVEEFAELSDQFEDPVNTYSSGMKARLGFAICVSLPFDIMLCDEALSVGDAKFAAKCLAKINELKSDRIFLFVSHSMTMVQRFCEKAIVLEQGKVVFAGPSTDAVAYYENNVLHVSETLSAELQEGPPSVQVAENRRSFLEPLMINENKIRRWRASHTIEGDNLVIDWTIEFEAGHSGSNKHRIGFPVFASDGTMLFGCTNEDLLKEGQETSGTTGRLLISNHGLHPGVYYVVLALFDGMEPILRQPLSELRVESSGQPRFGVYAVKHQWLNR